MIQPATLTAYFRGMQYIDSIHCKNHHEMMNQVRKSGLMELGTVWELMSIVDWCFGFISSYWLTGQHVCHHCQTFVWGREAECDCQCAMRLIENDDFNVRLEFANAVTAAYCHCFVFWIFSVKVHHSSEIRRKHLQWTSRLGCLLAFLFTVVGNKR